MAKEQKPASKGAASHGLRSPEDLDDYIKVMSPAVWTTLGVCLAFVAALLAWGVFGTVSTEITTSAVFEGESNQFFCFVTKDATERIEVGDIVYIEGVPLEIAEISYQPSASELDQDFLKTLIGYDYLREELLKNDSMYNVEIARPGYARKYREALDTLSAISMKKENNEISAEEAEAQSQIAIEMIFEAFDFSDYDFPENRILEATIVTESVSPIQLILGQ